MRHLVDPEILARLPNSGDLLAQANYAIHPAVDDLAEQPLGGSLYAIKDVGPDVESFPFRQDLDERMAQLRAAAVAHARKLRPRPLPDPWQEDPAELSEKANDGAAAAGGTSLDAPGVG